MVRKKGLESSRPCGHERLRLVTLQPVTRPGAPEPPPHNTLAATLSAAAAPEQDLLLPSPRVTRSPLC